ncbi:MAG: hypothetical protein K2J83_01740 [Clostridia bacterium]|nr:hypothetical protein [Clostridia bacterium]
MDEKNIYAQKLAKRAETGLAVIKILFFISLAAALGLVIFSITAFTVIDDAEAKLIGFAVFIAVIAALIIAVAVCFAVAKISLIKLKKME